MKNKNLVIFENTKINTTGAFLIWIVSFGLYFERYKIAKILELVTKINFDIIVCISITVLIILESILISGKNKDKIFVKYPFFMKKYQKLQ